jgi:hypothetical protein
LPTYKNRQIFLSVSARAAVEKRTFKPAPKSNGVTDTNASKRQTPPPIQVHQLTRGRVGAATNKAPQPSKKIDKNNQKYASLVKLKNTAKFL